MKNVKPGDPVTLTARQVNEWNKTAEAYRAGKFQTPETPLPNTQNPVVISIQNKTGEFAGIFSVLALGESVNLVGTDIDRALPDGIRKDVTFEGTQPRGDGAETVCITLGISRPDTMVSAVLTGAVGCVVDVRSTSHRYAVPVSGNSTKLQSSETGVIRILNPLRHTGEQFCYILLGGGGEGGGETKTRAVVLVAIPATPANFDYESDTLPPCGRIRIYGKTYEEDEDYDLCAADFLSDTCDEIIPVSTSIEVHGPYTRLNEEDEAVPYYVAVRTEGVYVGDISSAITGPNAVTTISIKNGESEHTLTNLRFPLLASNGRLTAGTTVWVRRDFGPQGEHLYIVRARCV